MLQNYDSTRHAAFCRDGDAFRIRRTWCNMPIAMAPPILMKICYTRVTRVTSPGVLNTTDWPICAPKIGQKKFLWFLGPGPGPECKPADSDSGPEKCKSGGTQSPPILGFGGLWERPTTPRRPVHGPVKENFRF